MGLSWPSNQTRAYINQMERTLTPQVGLRSDTHSRSMRANLKDCFNSDGRLRYGMTLSPQQPCLVDLESWIALWLTAVPGNQTLLYTIARVLITLRVQVLCAVVSLTEILKMMWHERQTHLDSVWVVLYVSSIRSALFDHCPQGIIFCIVHSQHFGIYLRGLFLCLVFAVTGCHVWCANIFKKSGSHYVSLLD